MTLNEFKAQVETPDNKSCYACKFFPDIYFFSDLCKKCDELTGEPLLVTVENSCGYFEKKLTPKEVIEKFNTRILKEKQEKNCSVCKKSSIGENNGGRWFGVCNMVKEAGAFVCETGDNTVCDCFEQREDNQ